MASQQNETEPQEMIPAAQKTRTLAHMNKSHRPDMRHILIHYGSVPAAPMLWLAEARARVNAESTLDKAQVEADGFGGVGGVGGVGGAEGVEGVGGVGSAEGEEDAAGGGEDLDPVMVDIDLEGITLRLPGCGDERVYVVRFEPRLAGWGERRERLVGMTRAAREALGAVAEGDGEGEKGVVVREYMPPRVGSDMVIFLAVLFYYFTFGLVRAGCFVPGGLPAWAVEMVRFPGGVDGFKWLVNTIFVPVLAIHVFETWLLERTKLQKFGVPRGSRVWWLWVGSVFIEGARAFTRFNIVVARLKAEGKKQR